MNTLGLAQAAGRARAGWWRHAQPGVRGHRRRVERGPPRPIVAATGHAESHTGRQPPRATGPVRSPPLPSRPVRGRWRGQCAKQLRHFFLDVYDRLGLGEPGLHTGEFLLEVGVLGK